MSSKSRKEPWRNNERHYCEVCNAWMGSDRQSILLHENGRKHKENVAKQLQTKRANKAEQEKSHSLLQKSLQQMEQHALANLEGADGIQFLDSYESALEAVTSSRRAEPRTKEPPKPPKKKRKEASKIKAEETPSSESKPKKTNKYIAPDEGHYEHGPKRVYLEGPTFAELLEQDMPVQLWTGPLSAGLAEKRLVERDRHWVQALIVKRRVLKHNQQVDCDVAYLQSPNDADETLEKHVALDRIRIHLGAHEMIPDTVEEARLLAMGGEEVKVQPTQQQQQQQQQQVELNEATGLSSWSTVSIKKTTVRQQVKEERAREREKRKRAIEEEQEQAKKKEARRMEEAKVDNADDSALGAFDVWSSNGGYKGVDINREANITIHDTGKSLAEGKGNVAFKKKAAFRKGKKKQNRRTTSADDD